MFSMCLVCLVCVFRVSCNNSGSVVFVMYICHLMIKFCTEMFLKFHQLFRSCVKLCSGCFNSLSLRCDEWYFSQFVSAGFMHLCNKLMQHFTQLGSQKQSPGGALEMSCSDKFCKCHRKAPVPESFFNEVTRYNLLLYSKEALTNMFSCEFCEFFQTIFL